MSFENLLNEKKVEKLTERQIVKLDFSEKDIDTAKNNLEIDFNWAFVIAYEAVLRAGNKLMNFLGYRAIGKEHHKNMFEFLRKIKINQDLVEYFDNIRKKRNDFIYRDAENIIKEEAEEIIKKAEKFVQEIKKFIK